MVIYPNFWDEKHHKTQSSLNFPFTERIVLITKPQQTPRLMLVNYDEMTISFSFLDSYLNCGVVRGPALGEEAESGVQPHHVVPLEAVLESSHQQGLVGVRVPPACGGQALAGRRDEGEVAGTDNRINEKLRGSTVKVENFKGMKNFCWSFR